MVTCFWRVGVVLAVLTSLSSLAGSVRPNVIVVITDDQGYGDIGAHGNPVILTPNLDKMHSESVRLTNYHVDPTCAPTRSALMTSHYSQYNGTWHTIMGRSLLRADETVMPQIFLKNGYVTHMSGKWHLGDNYPYRPWDRGFSSTCVHGGGGVGQTPDAWGNDYNDDRYWVNGALKKFEGYCTDVFFREALKFIEKNKKKPFFCYIATNAPHSPFTVADEYKALYAGKKVPNAAFWGMISNIDENLGVLREKLKEWELEENTILIFTTDNGTAAGAGPNGFNAGMRGTKGSSYDGGHRVPFFMHWPAGKLTGGRDVSRLTAHVDILPTLMKICGLKASEDLTKTFAGLDLTPILRGGTEWPDRVLFVESQRILHPEKWRNCSVMSERWRLINGVELYDAGEDPGQSRDVAGDHPEVVERLRGEYERWWTKMGERRDMVSRIVVGHDADNPARLTSHDWFSQDSTRVWNQGQIRGAGRNGISGNGSWNITVEQAGDYSISLRRWPIDIDRPITGLAEDGKKSVAIAADQARLKIGTFDQTKPVTPTDSVVTFTVALEKGDTELTTWFMDGDKKGRGAFFVYVERL